MDFYKSKGALSFVNKILDKIEDSLGFVSKWPDIGFVFHIEDDRVYRKIQISRNIIMIYRNDGQLIRILRVLDTRNQPEVDRFIEGL